MKPLFSVSLDIARRDVLDSAQVLIDYLEDEYGNDAMEVAGVSEEELMDAVIASKEFQKFLGGYILRAGLEVLDSPYDYFDGIDIMGAIPALGPIAKALDAACVLIHETEKEEEITCIKVPEGYKLVKI